MKQQLSMIAYLGYTEFLQPVMVIHEEQSEMWLHLGYYSN